ncbi:MAG: glycosyltransferase, partial [Planctomycetota bacterium]
MEVSVIIPTLNEAPTIVSAIQSARDFGATEVIVVDGGSQDATLTLAQSQNAICVESTAGRGKQLNAGARQAHSNWLLFLHADAVLPCNGLNYIRNAVDS